MPGDMRIDRPGALGGVNDEEDHLGPLDTPEGEDHAYRFGLVVAHPSGPTTPNLESTEDDENNNGIILAITTGNSKVVLTGDTEKEQWNAANLTPLAHASVFLASHHGREDGYSDRALTVIKPQRIIISDGKPGETDATAKYERWAPVSTTRKGSVVVRASQAAARV